MSSDDITDCVCDLGFTGPDGTACRPCDAGFFKDVNGSDACQACPVGTWLNVTNGTVCVSCPAYTDSHMSSDDITDCVCDLGFTGPDGTACTPCRAGSYKSGNGSGSCTPCDAGDWQNETASGLCQKCPANTFSLVGSDAIVDCICDTGYEGLDGAACSSCGLGRFKAFNGSGACVQCHPGTYLNETAGDSCKPCPENSTSIAGSGDLLACVCPVGFEPSDPAVHSAGCTPCPPGHFKARNGSEACAPCQQHAFQPSHAGSTCEACANGAYAEEGSVLCFEGDGLQRGCFSKTLPLDAVCAVRTETELNVSGCATSQEEFELRVLQVSGSRTDLGAIAGTCAGFYSWICLELGGAPSDMYECDFYCDLFAAVRSELRGACSSDAHCRAGAPPTHYSLQPSSAAVLCAEQAKYALYTSCAVPVPQQAAFAANVDSFLAALSSDACASVVPAKQELESDDDGPTPPIPGSSPDCSDKTDCRFACFNHGFAIVYEGSVIALRSKYLGECDCSLKGLFTGSIVYGEEMSVHASNALGDTASMHAVAAFNQMMLNIDSEDGQCIFSQNFNAGSLLGLPTESPVRPSKQGVLDFKGYDATLASSTAGSVLARRRFFRQSPGRRLTQNAGEVPLEFAGACPQQEEDCRHACLSSGLTSEAFGALLLLFSSHSGDCDCGEVFAGQSESGQPVLVGEVFLAEVDALSFSLPDQFFASFLPQDVNSSSYTAPVGFASAALVPFGEGMVLNVGGECAYRIGVAAGTLQLIREELAARQATIARRMSAAITLSLATPLEGGGARRSDGGEECAGVDTCEYSCLFSGLAKVADSGTEIMGNSPDKGCACTTYRGLDASATRVSGPGWSMEGDADVDAVMYRYWTGETINCTGYLNVVGGTFLGIPRPVVIAPPTTTPPPGEDEEDEIEPVAVETARDLAVSVTTVVGTALGVSVAASVAGSVAASAGAAAGMSASGGAASGGSATPVITQVQGLALYARIGGPQVQPESTREFSKGLEWANFHIIRLWGDDDDDTSVTGSRRASGNAEVAEEEKVSLGFIRSCRAAQLSSRELAGTWLMAFIAIAAASLARMAVNGFIESIFKRRCMESDGPAIPMLSWELQVYLFQFQGLAESAGEAIASKCFGYEIAGFLTLVVLALSGGFVLVVVALAIRKRAIRWQGKTFAEGVRNGGVFAYVCARVCGRVRVCSCVSACMYVCLLAYLPACLPVSVCAWNR